MKAGDPTPKITQWQSRADCIYVGGYRLARSEEWADLDRYPASDSGLAAHQRKYPGREA
jgi:hypothetical protein